MLSSHDELRIKHNVHGEDQCPEDSIDNIHTFHGLATNSHPTANAHNKAKSKEHHQCAEEVRSHACEIVLCLASEEGQAGNDESSYTKNNEHRVGGILHGDKSNHDTFSQCEHKQEDIVRR